MKILIGITGILLGLFMLGYGFAATGLRHPDNTTIFLGGFVVMFGSVAYLIFPAVKKR